MSQVGNNVYPNTTFPDSKQTLPAFTDLSSADQANYVNYLKSILAGDVNTANTYLNQITNTALINANKLNIIIDTIRAIQDVYSSTSAFTDIIDAKQTEWEKTINKFGYVGTWVQPTIWNSDTVYTTGNVVIYNNKTWRCLTTGVTSANPPSEGLYWTQYYFKGSIVTYYNEDVNRILLYIAVVEPNNTDSPDDSTQWMSINTVGDKGDNGQGFDFCGTWDSTAFYSVGNLVEYQGNAYSSLQNSNNNHNPATATTWWNLEFSIEPSYMQIQNGEPINLKNGELWFNRVS